MEREEILILGALLSADNNLDREQIESNLDIIDCLKLKRDFSDDFYSKLDEIEQILKNEL